MAKNLDADRIEKARKKVETVNRKEIERKRLRDTIQQNRNGERKVTVILPTKQDNTDQSTNKLRVAAYCRVSTAEEAQVGSFEMQVQHFTEVIENNPRYELARIYKDEGISGHLRSKAQGVSGDD